MHRIRLVTLVILAAAASVARAQGGPLCPVPAPLPDIDAPVPSSPDETTAAGDRVESAGPLTTLEGNAAIRQGEHALSADRIQFDRGSSHAQASGNVVFTTADLEIRADEGAANLDTGALAADDSRYRMPSLPAQGRAQRLARGDRGVSTLQGGTFSTCPAEAEAWHLASSEVTLDPTIRQGTARNVSLWFKGVPLFYSPWFRFPLGDARLSGFLAPRLGRSNDGGADIALPWYWNAAPNFDATLTPRLIERRGEQLQQQWRWLGPAGYWQLDNEYLPDDELAGEDRVLTRLEQHASFGNWSTDVEAARASDPAYFEDLGTRLALSSQTHLRQRGDVNWNGDAGRFRLRAERYQTLDQTIAPRNRPYQRMPQVTFQTGDNRGALATWAAETPGWFVRPRLAVDHTSYRVDQVGPNQRRDISRTLPIASLDTGLVLDRFGNDYRQTLEPRAFYVHIPDEEQSDIPLFDTGEYGFSFSQLFRERRFTGGDRIGDANRLSLALTSRVLSRATGREVLRGSIGAIRHFDEREVSVDGTPDTDETSDLIAEVGASPIPHWNGRITVQWDSETDVVGKRNASLRYRGPRGGVANLGYRLRRNDNDQVNQEQVDLSFAWPISPRWEVVARNNYSLHDERNVDSLAGFEYKSCCWRLRTVAREYITGSDEASRGIFFELVLDGLGGAGDDTGSLLERAILGYRAPESQASGLDDADASGDDAPSDPP